MAYELPADLTTGSVAVDVGDGVGALLVHAGASCVGEEIEVERLDSVGTRTHVAVLGRRVGERIVHAAVFPALHAGEYRVLRGDGATARPVRILERTITELDWR